MQSLQCQKLKQGHKQKHPKTPANVAASNITADNATIKWDAVERADYYLIYINNNPVEVTGTSYTFPAVGATYYSVMVSAVNEVGESPKSDPVIFTTPPDAPQNLQYHNLTSTSVTLTWEGVEGAETYYIYRYSIKIVETNDLTWSTTYLKPGTAYNFYVTAIGEGGESEKSNWIYFTAPEEEPQE
ncbi:fibronectin type III domain-containing protein [Bacillus vallismortis]|uniref:fibronectin type III domain-containing protein n=1 Tax=Bacillus vallismortis TaxID=72361 RepID=UPI003DB1BA7D